MESIRNNPLYKALAKPNDSLDDVRRKLVALSKNYKDDLATQRLIESLIKDIDIQFSMGGYGGQSQIAISSFRVQDKIQSFTSKLNAALEMSGDISYALDKIRVEMDRARISFGEMEDELREIRSNHRILKTNGKKLETDYRRFRNGRIRADEAEKTVSMIENFARDVDTVEESLYDFIQRVRAYRRARRGY